MKNDKIDFKRFVKPSFDDFKKMAKDESLSMYEKIGFPNSYRAGKEEYIFQEIKLKLNLNEAKTNQVLLDIGCGCSELPLMIQNECKNKGVDVVLVDAEEMLNLLPNKPFITKFPGAFPDDVPKLINNYYQKIDYILAYSNLQLVFQDACIYKFIDTALSLLNSGGKMLIGDVPNISKRNRFFSSEQGKLFHRQFMNVDTDPEINHYQLEPNQLDDSIFQSIVQRYRSSGYDAYILPQGKDLPFANRREDILICKL